jgi:hypothetical protein
MPAFPCCCERKCGSDWFPQYKVTLQLLLLLLLLLLLVLLHWQQLTQLQEDLLTTEGGHWAGQRLRKELTELAIKAAPV